MLPKSKRYFLIILNRPLNHFFFFLLYSIRGDTLVVRFRNRSLLSPLLGKLRAAALRSARESANDGSPREKRRKEITFVVFSGSLGTSVFDTDVYLVGASGGVYALLAAHLANVLLNYNNMEFGIVRLIGIFVIGKWTQLPRSSARNHRAAAKPISTYLPTYLPSSCLISPGERAALSRAPATIDHWRR